ncbi:helix-turn-helix domain-containing protein [Nocardioides panacisoli]|uniref:helix-turn-helix domain-containing protein n=1 Tax=Nocardioides panacisoli TaxID=627624 RepID=UPI001C6286FE|nr:helix-turn-helix domain-containing protein [Nocardioides panacisoli]QYJ02947.1 helix-turn-helix domain-containing protein [Nocardioides panacisoli]
MAQSEQTDLITLPPDVAAGIRAELPHAADEVVNAIIEEVPSYEDAFSGPMGRTIRNAVEVALDGFLALLGENRGADAPISRAAAVDGAYQLGRGEARSGRTTDALLSAYRIGARVAWQQMAGEAVHQGLDATTLAAFAQLVFTYIDEMSAASVAGHADESASSSRLRQQRLERISRHLLAESPPATVVDAAERAEWSAPETLTAVVVPEAQVAPLLQRLPARTLQAADLPELEERTLLLVPDMHGAARPRLLRDAADRGCLVGPARPWLRVRASYDRVLRADALGLTEDTEAHLPALVVAADADALADLREQALAPLEGLRPATIEKLTQTLRAWLLHQGRRDDVAAALFVHPQTVRYRMGQLREAYGDALADPGTVLALTIALGADA